MSCTTLNHTHCTFQSSKMCKAWELCSKTWRKLGVVFHILSGSKDTKVVWVCRKMKFQSLYVHYLQNQGLDIEHVYRKLRGNATGARLLKDFEKKKTWRHLRFICLHESKLSCAQIANHGSWQRFWQIRNTHNTIPLQVFELIVTRARWARKSHAHDRDKIQKACTVSRALTQQAWSDSLNCSRIIISSLKKSTCFALKFQKKK